MDLRFKALNEKARISKAHEADAGFDLTATSIEACGDFIEYGTGIAVDIPKGFVGLLFPRSSISKHSMLMCNSVGVVDAGYHGEVRVRMRVLGTKQKKYEVGDRVAQLVLVELPEISMIQVDDFGADTDRGDGGFGSSGA